MEALVDSLEPGNSQASSDDAAGYESCFFFPDFVLQVVCFFDMFKRFRLVQIPKRRSGMKLARIPSSKYKKASTKKLVAAADQKTKLRKSRSIKLSRQSSRNIFRSTTTRPGIKKVSPSLLIVLRDFGPNYCGGNRIRIVRGSGRSKEAFRCAGLECE